MNKHPAEMVSDTELSRRSRELSATLGIPRNDERIIKIFRTLSEVRNDSIRLARPTAAAEIERLREALRWPK